MKSRKMVIAGYKAAETRKLNKKLAVRGLTTRQIAGYKAAHTLRIQKIGA